VDIVIKILCSFDDLSCLVNPSVTSCLYKFQSLTKRPYILAVSSVSRTQQDVQIKCFGSTSEVQFGWERNSDLCNSMWDFLGILIFLVNSINSTEYCRPSSTFVTPEWEMLVPNCSESFLCTPEMQVLY
jgi:hypothetical protein